MKQINFRRMHEVKADIIKGLPSVGVSLHPILIVIIGPLWAVDLPPTFFVSPEV